MKTLNLVLKKKWFDMIASGEKKEEYRELKPLYSKKFLSHEAMLNPFFIVRFRHGYATDAPEICFWIESITIGKANPEWSDNWQGNVFVIKLGERLSDERAAMIMMGL